MVQVSGSDGARYILVFFREPVILLIWILVLPDLSFIPSKLKAVMAVLCAIGMTVLMGLGYSHQPWWVDLIDVVVAAFFLFIIVGAVIWGEDDSRQDVRPNLSVEARVRWFVLYAGLTATLVLILLYQTTLLPVQATQ